MRIDKYLKNSRIIKRRTVAKEVCEQGKVYINGNPAKPGDEVKIGDIVEVNFGNGVMKIEIKSVADNVPKNKSQDLYKVL